MKKFKNVLAIITYYIIYILRVSILMHFPKSHKLHIKEPQVPDHCSMILLHRQVKFEKPSYAPKCIIAVFAAGSNIFVSRESRFVRYSIYYTIVHII
jgi:hypothetical protein